MDRNTGLESVGALAIKSLNLLANSFSLAFIEYLRRLLGVREESCESLLERQTMWNQLKPKEQENGDKPSRNSDPKSYKTGSSNPAIKSLKPVIN